MSRLSWRPRKKNNIQESSKPQQERKVLVISGWWFRWAYALGVMKAMEEFWIDKEIDAIYWVSIWAIVGSLWGAWMKADKIFSLLSAISVKDFYGTDVFSKSWWLASSKKIWWMLEEYLPKDFESLNVPFYAWVVDTNTAEYLLFDHWNLHKIVLWSMSIPWVFPPVDYDGHSFVDWWVLNNFPVDLAKQKYPSHKIIGIALNKFKTNQKIKSTLDNLSISFEVMMRSKLLENTKLVDYLFYRELPISTLSLNKKDMKESFDLGYNDWVQMFSEGF